MKESIGSTFLYNMIFVFIIVVFGLITATLNYYKGYKVNTRILQAIEKNSGYNKGAKKEIDRVLNGLGYTKESNGIQNKICASKKGKGELITSNNAQAGDNSYPYCVYLFNDETKSGELNNDKKPAYYAFGVTTYIYVDLPIVGKFKIPVYSKGERMYRFSSKRS